MNVFNSSRSTGPGGATRRTDTHNVSQVWVPPGCFLMGTDPKVDHPAQEASTHVNEFPQHRVCITKGFWLDEYEVTNASYRDFIGDGGYIKQKYWSPAGWKWKTDNSVQPDPYNELLSKQPRGNLTYYEAEAYAHWRGGRLPTEAEWEYAARGPNNFIYPWGNDYNYKAPPGQVVIDPNDPGNFVALGKPKPAGPSIVGSYPVNKSWVGAYDMAGNVYEWVTDIYDANYYASSPMNDPKGPTSGTTGSEYIVRGGSWQANLYWARTAARHNQTADFTRPIFGARIASDAQ